MKLYERNCGAATSTPGLSLVKIRYEHLYLTSFSKMRVDLAAEVHACNYIMTVHVLTCNVIFNGYYIDIGSQRVSGTSSATDRG